MNKNARNFVEAATSKYGEAASLSREQIQNVCDECKVPFPYWLVTKQEYRSGRGVYRLPTLENGTATKTVAPVRVEPAISQVEMSNVHILRQKKMYDETDTAIPEKFPGYVPFGFYKDLQHIIQSRQFYPIFITGMTGNGKTLMVEQVCAVLKRECIRVNISIETDESDLIGTNTLIDGNIVYRDGPVITAMKRGAILLIDEIDRGSNKLMCIQGILEGKPYFNKKSGEYVHPTAGFNIIATANTKGQGSEDGKYLTQILDSAFLERFPITVEQEYPDSKVELRIMYSLIEDKDFAENLVKWADVIRKTYKEGGIDEVISTRRLVHIANAYKIFNDRKKAIQLCIARFDDETKTAFLDLYTKVDIKVAEQVVVETSKVEQPTTESDGNDIPF